MNNTSQCIFDICHVLKHLRDTLEYVFPREHDINVYNSRKQVVTSLLDERSFLGKFIKENDEKLKQFREKYSEFVDDIYSEKSSIITVTSDNKLRIDHTQHIKLFDYVIYLSETIRDILYSHVNFAISKNEKEDITFNLVKEDEKFDRIIKTLLTLQEYQKSFNEFQKVMSETKGQPSPQSNFIVTNELNKMAQMIRFVRAHAHCTDNHTLDLLDEVIELIEMTEGRRDRRDNKPFTDFFKSCYDALGKDVNELSPIYQKCYEDALKEMLATIKARQEEANGAKA